MARSANSTSTHPDRFLDRHIGPSGDERSAMLAAIGAPNMEALVQETVPDGIRLDAPMALPAPLNEAELLVHLREMAAKNTVAKSYIGLGYYPTVVPAVIRRNVLENPGWYTQYTPYQAEIAQGRLEALLNFQTAVADLTGLPIANASLLDEGSAAGEAMLMFFHAANKRQIIRTDFLVSENVLPQTLEVLRTKADPQGIHIRLSAEADMVPDAATFGVLLPYPGQDGSLNDPSALIQKAHDAGAYALMTCDLLALTLLASPGDLGADAAVGSAQRFGVPMGFGGPHAAFFATGEGFKRQIPGRIIGVSIDRRGNHGLRMALQTREQHIRREKATSNICTAQALLAIMTGFYAVYHGAEGLRRIALHVHEAAVRLDAALTAMGYSQQNEHYFDTLRVGPGKAGHDMSRAFDRATKAGMNFRWHANGDAGISLHEGITEQDLLDIVALFHASRKADTAALLADPTSAIPAALARQSSYLTHPVFGSHRSETDMMRYIKRLENKDTSLVHSMIPLGSCTMKLNAAVQLEPVSWPSFGSLHPFCPPEQATGYHELIANLENYLCAVTGFSACSLQPNSGAQGEYTGLMTIRAYHHDRGDENRKVVLIPASAHGTNPASAVVAGMQVVVTGTDERGNIDMADLQAKLDAHRDNLAGLMVTYPSTHGVFEETIQAICAAVHEAGGLVYMDGANMNAQVGLTSPARIGADVCHLNLHKTFSIPHGGGGPGMGPICVNEKLAPFLPGHPLVSTGGEKAIGPVAAAPWGSASILLVPYAYIRLLGAEGCTEASRMAILNANYLETRLSPHFPILYTGAKGRAAHEFIVDLRPFKAHGVEVEDIAKRLMDYGFHAPTVSFPVPGTMMIEPTESESQAELDRFCEAMIAIREEIRDIAEERLDPVDNPLKNAPHILQEVCANQWTHPYPREQAAFPLPWVMERKCWPTTARIDNSYGDRNLVCTCPPMSDYMPEASVSAGMPAVS